MPKKNIFYRKSAILSSLSGKPHWQSGNSLFADNPIRAFAGGGLLQGLGNAIAQVVPPLQVPYIPITPANPADLASIPLKLQKESFEAGEQLAKDAQGSLEKVLDKADWLAHDRDLVRTQLRGVQTQVQSALRENPMYLASNANRQRVTSAYGDILNSANAQLFTDRKKQVGEFYSLHKENNSLDQLYLNPKTDDTEEDDTGKAMTNRDVHNEVINSKPGKFYDLMGINQNDPVGRFEANTSIGTLENTNKSIDEMTALIDSSSSETDIERLLPGVAAVDMYNNYLQSVRKVNGTVSNQEMINAAIEAYSTTWKESLDDRAVNGLRQKAYALYANMEYKGNLLPAPAGKPAAKDGKPLRLTNSQALMLAKRTGKADLLSELQNKRETFTQTYGSAQVKNRIFLRSKTATKYQYGQDLSSLKNAGESGGGGADGSLLDRPFFLPSEQNDVLTGDTGLFVFNEPDKLSVAMLGKSSRRPDDSKVVPLKSFSGEVYEFSDARANNAAFDGRPSKVNEVVENVIHVDNVVYAITTGETEVYDTEKKKWIKKDGKKNHVILKGDNRGDFEIDEYQPPTEWEPKASPELQKQEAADHSGESYYLSKDKRTRTYFKPKSVEKWLDAANKRVILVPDSRGQSLTKYGAELTSYETPKKYLSGSSLNEKGKALTALLTGLQGQGRLSGEMQQDMQQLVVAGADLTDANNRRIVNAILGRLDVEIVKQQLYNTQSQSKPSFSPTNPD